MSSGTGVTSVDWIFAVMAVGMGTVTLAVVLARLNRTFDDPRFGRRPAHAGPRRAADPIATALLAGSAIVKFALSAFTAVHVRLWWLWYVLLALGMLRLAFTAMQRRRGSVMAHYGSRAGRYVRRR